MKKDVARIGTREVAGVLMVFFCVAFVLSLFSYRSEDISLIQSPSNVPTLNFIGPAGAWVAFILFMGLGIGAYLVPVFVGIWGVLAIFKREGRVWPKALWMLAILISVTGLLEMNPAWWEVLTDRLNIGSSGGAVGYLLIEDMLVPLMGGVGTAILLIAILITGLFLLTEMHPIILFRSVALASSVLYRKAGDFIAKHRSERAQIEHEQNEVAKRRRRLEEVMRAQELEQKREREGVRRPALRPAVVVSPESLRGTSPETSPGDESEDEIAAAQPRERRRAGKPSGAAEPHDTATRAPVIPSNYLLPPMNLLDPLPPESEREIKGDFQASADILKDTLAEFGVEVDVTNVERGPVVTRFELLPAPGVRVEKIAGLSNNIALAMKAESIRVQAPIPGKGVVGIEVPNPKTTMVYLREILEKDAWISDKAALPLALGKDVGGREIISDLAEMPHMLIAGATGSGKTVCMNSILAGLLMTRTPDQLRLMLIDPKIVEFSVYNHLPHLVVPVITDAKKVAIGLRWVINEMEKRYKLFAKVGVRNIKAFNSRPILKQAELFEGAVSAGEPAEAQPPDHLPYIVVVVDELADLMLVAQVDIEAGIARLAQLSRAVGIHMILATQRPSVNVITGTIKANFPARLSFQVAQKVDSRTILDANGADKLLGKGDMLFLPPGTSRLVRAQGTMTTDAEIRRIVEFWKKQGQPQYEVSIKDKIEGRVADLPDMEEDDELIQAAMEIIRQTKRASTSSLQRRLRIGYTRAARIMDLLEERGIVGPAQGADPREILVDLDGEIPQNKPYSADE